VPRPALDHYSKEFEEPGTDEGFEDIKRITWTFDGSEEERRRWAMWLDL
jgi:hypothetical protein